ncbi:hypothetical protein [Rhodopila sp.]|uniref:hypothetical protein n=1 Tax=Rhodopila sp. TaxID=2480087 RepID=UPI003D1496C9
MGDFTVMKFRDPDGHPLELLQVPQEPRSFWQGTGLLGIDHSAIGVADAGAGRRFYEALGLTARTPMLSAGLARAALDGLEEAEVGVVPLMPREAPPHLKLLAYHTSKGVQRSCRRQMTLPPPGLSGPPIATRCYLTPTATSTCCGNRRTPVVNPRCRTGL